MAHLVSTIIHSLDMFDPTAEDQAISGAKLATVNLLTGIARHPEVEALEIYAPAEMLTDRAFLEKIAHFILPPQLRGKNRLRFYVLQSMPDIWNDAKARIFYSPSPESMASVRYLRDTFARGPMPIVCDTHAYSHNSQLLPIAHYAQASPVPYDSIVSLSTSCLETTRRMLGDYSGRTDGSLAARLDMIPRGIHPDQFYAVDQDEKAAFRRTLGLPADGTIALFLGRVSPFTKADLMPLLRAFAAASEKSDEYLLIAGEERPEGYGKSLLELAETLGIGGRVIVHGRVEPNLRIAYYGSSDLFVFPGDTIIETFGSTVIEAMACGLPCIISDWDGLRDTVVDGETGFKIRTWWMPAHDRIAALSPVTPDRIESLYIGQTVWVDSRSLATALRKLLTDPDLRCSMGKAGVDRVAKNYTWDIVLSAWIALCNELAALAAQETAEQKETRVEDALALGLPNEYLAHFSHYATGIVDPAKNAVRLSAYGACQLEQSREIYFYDACLPLTKPAVLNMLAETVKKSGSEWIRINDLTEIVARDAATPEDDVRFHIALLLKGDILELC